MSMLIRQEQPADYPAIDEVNTSAFGQPNEARLVRRIREAEGFDPRLSLVALDDEQILGHIHFSPIRIEDQGKTHAALALAPMAVRPEVQRQGIGSRLVTAGLAACRDAGYDIVVVLGHAEYYPRFGFAPASRHGIKPPFPVPDEAFLIQALTPGALDGVRGTVHYPPAFDDV